MPITAEIRGLVARRLAVGDTVDPDARLFTGPRGGRISTAVLHDATHWDEAVTGSAGNIFAVTISATPG